MALFDDPRDDIAAAAEEAVALARSLWEEANARATAAERRRGLRLARLAASAHDKAVLVAWIDRGFRPGDPRRALDVMTALLASEGIPRFFSPPERAALRLLLRLGALFPAAAVRTVFTALRRESRAVIIPGEKAPLEAYLAARRREGLRVNLNRIGEEVLGEAEARAFLAAYREDLRNPAVEQIAVKISSLVPWMEPLAFEENAARIAERLGLLYREAAGNRFLRPDGSTVPKTVTLDMEGFRDLALTAAAFRRTLERPEFQNVFAGIALQAYLPDSLAILHELCRWAEQRVASGGSPIKIRIVKGANLEMERLEAAHRNWPLAPFERKADTDAQWKRMVAFLLDPQRTRAVRPGIASHNPFDLAFACRLAERRGVKDRVQIEMLEGMANPLRRAIAARGFEVLAYAPTAERRHFLSAIAYLVRRLDENTGKEHFLRHAGRLKPGGGTWRSLEAAFRDSLARMGRTPPASHRLQDRRGEEAGGTAVFPAEAPFRNEPFTDWALAANRAWARAIRERWRRSPGTPPLAVPLVVAGEEIAPGAGAREEIDPNALPRRIGVSRTAAAGEAEIERAITAACEDADGWRTMTPAERERILFAAAREIATARGEFLGAAAATTGKLFTETDPEVSEAVDFARYYPLTLRRWFAAPHLRPRGKGVTAVLSPWNFPVSIPCGGIAAALAAGNTVVFKPSSLSVTVGWLLARCFYRAGVPPSALAFVPCAGAEAGRRLVLDPRVDAVILTGGTETAREILRERPDLSLSAETGGKNATIVTATADRDQAIAHVVVSAFGNSGQKCSATSLLLLEREVYEDESFRRRLADAATSFRTGSAWDFRSRMGPLVRPPEGILAEALTRLEPGEFWDPAPRRLGDNVQLWTPGIRWGVRPGSVAHRTEFFGPVLAVMCARDLEEAVALANQTGYGLTAGLESLDPSEWAYWRDHIRAGNLYINRPTTGAIVGRQPFGGMGKSSFGAGLQAGGPHYALQFLDFAETGPPPLEPVRETSPLWRLAGRWEEQLAWGRFAAEEAGEIRRAVFALRSALAAMEREFAPQDAYHLRGQENRHRFLPAGTVVVRVHPEDGLFETVARVAAARAAGNRVRISLPPGLETAAVRFLRGPEGRLLAAGARVVEEDEEGLIGVLDDRCRIRAAAPGRVSPRLLAAAAEHGVHVARAPVLMEGRLELLHVLRGQSLSIDTHRWGNLGFQAPRFED
ncbi:MAG: bifunctional proline dehydrogenase/L-glutamate gamma-semialdehyde dehydrogenase [Desulfobacterales bacterium]